MKTRIIILGAGVMQGPVIRIAKEMDLYTVVVDADSGALNAPLADRFEQIDLKDKEGIETLGRSLQAEGNLGGIMTAGTDFSSSVAWVAERLGLPGIPYEAALNASDKGRMRACFEKAGVPSPAYRVLSSPAEIPADLSLPAVVKPVDNMGSRGCRRVDSPAEVEKALIEALNFSRSRRAIVEDFMEGPEFSVDAVVYDDDIIICGLADRHIFFPPYFIEMGHTMPTNAPPGDQQALLETFKAAVRALGIAGKGCRGAAKGDVKLSPGGPMIGETAARLSGGYMSGWTYPYSSGVQPIRGAVQAALGRRPEGLAPTRSWTCAERAFISIPGRVRSVAGIEGVNTAEAGVRDLFIRTGAGRDIQFPENNVSKGGNVIACAPRREDAVRAAEQAARSILIRLEPRNPATDAFLAAPSPASSGGAGTERPGDSGEGPGLGEPAFPPPAFSLEPRLRAALARIPDPPRPSAGSLSGAGIIPFPEFASSGLRDYMGRSVEETLKAVRELSGLSLPLGGGNPLLGRSFWAALVRGGYQGALYFLDN
ncbi:MAG: ATP-grasp domain-containing protein [Treponema sp.]|jgi:biotin carboxylase|nr:ATP-grasp domain-containing protein [Treponema sp.]